MKKILIAVPTKDRSEMVKEVLEYELIYYNKYNIDICYYDSSSDDKTKDVIDELNRNMNSNIIYREISGNLCLDYKIIEMFREFSKDEYDYYWLINDSISISEEMIQNVLEKAEVNYDLIRLPLAGYGNREDYITNDVNDWFNNCSAGMAHMASTVMSRTLLQGSIDWEDYRNKYVYNNVLDDEHGYFFTVGFYLEQISRLKSFSGIYLGNKCKWRRDSHLKKNNIYWFSYVFETWAKSYPETILKIPDIYQNKEEVIKKSDNLGSGRFSKEMLIHYRIKGIYDEEKYNKYHKYFKYITEESDELCYRIAVTPINVLKEKYPNLVSLEDEWESKLEQIEKKISGKKIYLYGAGLYGEKVAKKLQQDGYRDDLIGILVTSKLGNVDEICDIEILAIDEVDIREDEYIIICALPSTSAKIKEELMKRRINKFIGLFDI